MKNDPRLRRFVVYDVETLRTPEEVDGGWDNPQGMGFGCACSYDYRDDRYRFFCGPDGQRDLISQLDGRTAVTFNGIHFDSRVLLGNDRLTDALGMTYGGGAGWNNYDILLEYIKSRYGYTSLAEAEKRLGDKEIHDGSFNLDGLAEGTLGRRKNGSGELAPRLLDAGDYDRLFAYNLQDVRLTRDLFEHILIHREVVARDGRHTRINTLALYL